MLLQDLFDQLTYGELAKVSLGGDPTIGILEKDYANIISHINLGLTELYKRFPLKEDEISIQLEDNIQTYYLHSDYALTNDESIQPDKYLIDSEFHPFNDTVLKIEQVIDENGEILYLNDSNQAWSVFSPSYNSIQVPYASSEIAVTVTYRADHARIPNIGADPSTYDVPIPMTHLEPLLYYIASRIHTTLPTLDGVNKGNDYLAKYEAACTKIENLALTNKSDPSNHKLWDRGFV